jgi:hypothetical protein
MEAGQRSRVLTQKYNMAVLKKLSELDQQLVAWLCKMFEVEEEDIPVEIDLHEIYNGDKGKWEESLVSTSSSTSRLDRLHVTTVPGAVGSQ